MEHFTEEIQNDLLHQKRSKAKETIIECFMKIYKNRKLLKLLRQ